MPIFAIVVLIVVVLGIVIAIFGWDRYRGGKKATPAGDAAEPTSEVFIDPETGRRMRVWYDAKTGQRDYRPE